MLSIALSLSLALALSLSTSTSTLTSVAGQRGEGGRQDAPARLQTGDRPAQSQIGRYRIVSRLDLITDVAFAY